jgi:hypothetical protein
MNPMNVNFQSLLDEAREAYGRRSARVVERLGPDSALWLVAVPQWTDQLAKHAGFPTGTASTVAEFLDREVARGIIQRRMTVDDKGQPLSTFWVAAELRRQIAVELRDRGVQWHPALRAIASAIKGVSRVPVPAVTSLWAKLVGSGAGISGRQVVERTRELVDRDDLADAAALSTAAEAIAPPGDPMYETALVRARRLIHLGYRNRHDRYHLDHFVRRPEQADRLHRFLQGGPDAWALHLLGMGGVGKTMLIRYLASGLFADEQGMARFPVARIDFDNLSPDYPARRPVQLLLELADELVPYADTPRSDRALRDFYSLAESAHSAATAGELPSGSPIVDDAIDRFAAFLNELPRPVVLVLDTCEELAKLRPAADEAPAVQRTFDRLERVHAGCPDLKVLLAGRRYLARQGRGWRIPDGLPHRLVASLGVRDYLDLALLRGFDKDEARRYLMGHDPAHKPTAEQLEAFLELAPELRPLHGEREVRRYNPFDLALYRSWWEDDPDLDPATLRAAGRDAYIDGRIVKRLHDAELEALLPAVALFGRFDATMLQPLCGTRSADDVFERLAEQEWVKTSLDRDTGMAVLVIDELLRERLLAWATAPQRRADLDHTRVVLAGHLAKRLHNADLGTITIEQVVVALRLARADEAASLLATLEDRIGIDRRWDWAANVLDRIRGELEGQLDQEPLFDAAVRAATISVTSRTTPGADYSADWRRVLDAVTAGRTTADTVSASLAKRARVALMAEDETADTAKTLGSFLASLPGSDTADAVPVVAAAETVLSRVPPAEWETLGSRLVGIAGRAMLRWASTIEPQVGAAALVVGAAATGKIARITLRPEARRLAQQANHTVARTWADWPLQDGRDHRVWAALHEAAASPPVEGNVLDEWERLALAQLANVDGERLLSRVVELRAAHAPLPLAKIDALARRDSYVPTRLPHSALHDAVPPLFVTLAASYYRAGQPARAEQLLLDRRETARNHRTEDVTVHAAREALVWLAIRLRRPGYRPSMIKGMIADCDRPRARALALALQFLADGRGRAEVEQYLARPDTSEDPALAMVRLELAATLRPGRADELRELSRRLRHSDPITSWQLWVCALLPRARQGAETDSRDVSELEDRYRRARAIAPDLPPLPVAARTDHHGAWEQWLIRHDALTMPNFEATRQGHGEFPSAEPRSDQRWAEGGVSVWVPEEWAELVTEAYGVALGTRLEGPPGVAVAAGQSAPRLAHLMGRPVRTSYGMVLQVRESREEFSGRYQNYLSPADITSANAPTGQAVVTVLQGVPYDGPFDPDPVGADATRRLGLDVVHNAPTRLIVIPPLPVDVARQVVHMLGELASRRAVPQDQELEEFVDRVKQAIVRAGDHAGQSSAAREVAHDGVALVKGRR